MKNNLQDIYKWTNPNCQCSGMKFGGKCSCSYTKSLKARFNAITGVQLGGEKEEELEELLPSVEFSEGANGFLCAEGDCVNDEIGG
ncbi:hypothetical protein SK128_011610, partial [Halocaridina rubra]